MRCHGNLLHVRAIDLAIRNLERCSKTLERRMELIRRGRELAPSIVLANEQQWKLPYRRQVQALMQGSLGQGAIIEERNCHVRSFLDLMSQCAPNGDRQPATHDAIRAQHTDAHL